MCSMFGFSDRNRDHHNFRRRNSRSRSRDRNLQQHRRGHSGEQDLYRDLIYNDYQDDPNNYGQRGGYDMRQNRGGGNRGCEDDGRDGRDDRHRPYWNDRQRDGGPRDRDNERDRDRK